MPNTTKLEDLPNDPGQAAIYLSKLLKTILSDQSATSAIKNYPDTIIEVFAVCVTLNEILELGLDTPNTPPF